VNDTPNNIQPNRTVVLNQDVSHAAHADPVQVRIARMYFRRDVARGLADGLNVPNNGVDDSKTR
jgi:hypothetical protein